MILVEIDLIRLPMHFAHPFLLFGSLMPDLFLLLFQIFDLFSHPNKFVLQTIKYLKFLRIKQFLLIIDPNIFQLNIENIIQNLLDFILCLEFADWSEGYLVMFVIVLLYCAFIEYCLRTTVFQAKGEVDT